MGTMTMEAFSRAQENLDAVLHGKINIDGLIESTNKLPFYHYLARFISEKTGKDVAEITHKDVIAYCEEQTADFSGESKAKLEEFYKDNVFKQDIRRCFSLEREIKRATLLKLVFRLNCSCEEAEELLLRLGEPTFYLKNRYEALVWWSLKQPNKFETYCNLEYLLNQPRTTLTFGSEATRIVSERFQTLSVDSEELFKTRLLQLEESNEKSKSVSALFNKIISAIRKDFDKKFDRSLEAEIEKIREEIDDFYMQLDNPELSHQEVAKKEQAIYNREVSIVKKTNEYYDKESSIRKFAKLLEKDAPSTIKTFNYNRIFNILKGNRKTITREDLITAMFISFVLKKYYFDDAESLYDTINNVELDEEYDLEDLITENAENVTDFIDMVDSELTRVGFFELNFSNPYEAFLVLCLATPSPLICFAKNSHNYFDFGVDGDS